MRKFLILGSACIFMVMGCSPSTPIALTPTVIPIAAPTVTPAVTVENPPPCWGADLIYHKKLHQILLVNCVTDPGKETLLTVWGWDGTRWQKVTEGGPAGRILGGAAYDEMRNVLVLYGGRPEQYIETQVKFEDGRIGSVSATLRIMDARTFAPVKAAA